MSRESTIVGVLGPEGNAKVHYIGYAGLIGKQIAGRGWVLVAKKPLTSFLHVLVRSCEASGGTIVRAEDLDVGSMHVLLVCAIENSHNTLIRGMLEIHKPVVLFSCPSWVQSFYQNRFGYDIVYATERPTEIVRTLHRAVDDS